jgi:hypothetical protein
MLLFRPDSLLHDAMKLVGRIARTKQRGEPRLSLGCDTLDGLEVLYTPSSASATGCVPRITVRSMWLRFVGGVGRLATPRLFASLSESGLVVQRKRRFTGLSGGRCAPEALGCVKSLGC